MIRKIIKINEDLCNGCGACASACHEGAIGMANGKAKLLRDDYCDGLGACLPVCPTDAIKFIEREADEYDEAAVKAAQASKQAENIETSKQKDALPCGCPGTQAKTIQRNSEPASVSTCATQTSQLRQWPVQIKLVPVSAPYLDGAHLLIAADCCAYSYGNFHSDFIKNKITLIGCPKLDEGDYSEKLTEILKRNNIKSVTVARMEVPCCGGIENALKAALKNCEKLIPWQVVVISTDGRLLQA